MAHYDGHVEAADSQRWVQIDELSSFKREIVGLVEVAIDKLKAENQRLEPLAKFGELALQEVKKCVRAGGFEIEGCVLADMAVGAGLMTTEPYDPKVHGDVEADPGDEIYSWENKVEGYDA